MNTKRQSAKIPPNPPEESGNLFNGCKASLLWSGPRVFLRFAPGGRSLHEVRHCRPDLWPCRGNGIGAVRLSLHFVYARGGHADAESHVRGPKDRLPRIGRQPESISGIERSIVSVVRTHL